MSMQTVLWIVFAVVLAAMLALDLGVFHRGAHTVKLREALTWSGIWIALALLFNLGIFLWRGQQAGLEFLTGYLIEKSLSVDNIFVFALIFSYFSVPSQYQYKVLFWGVLGALVMRAVLIALGVQLIALFHWAIYVFGGFLVVTGVRMALERDREVHPERNPLLRLMRRVVPITSDYQGDRLLVKQAVGYCATPLLVVLVTVETTDLVFAIDSIPAILAVTRDPFIVYTSNAFAILGLRALYFALAGLVRRFEFLHYGLAAVLAFVGIKMVISDIYEMPITLALGVVAAILLVAAVASALHPDTPQREPASTGRASERDTG